MVEPITAEYERRKAASHAEFTRLKSRADVFALGVGLLALMTGRQLWLAIGTSISLRNTAVALTATLMVVAVWRVVVARERRQARITNLYATALGRVNEAVTQTGHTGVEFVPEDHLYAWDLDIMGESSLLGKLATTRTAIGQRALAELLLQPGEAPEVRQRQTAVQELTPMLDLSERVALLGASKFEEIPSETYEDWLDVETPAPQVWYRPLLVAVNALWIGLVLVSWLHYGGFAVLLHPLESVLLAQAMLCLWLRPQSLRELAAAKRLLGQTAILRRGLAIVQSETFRSDRLLTLQRACAGEDQALRHLERWLTVVEHRDKEWFSALCVTFCGGTHAACALRNWKRTHGVAMRRWLAAWSELEALLALATYAAEHSRNVYPEVLDQAGHETAFEATGMTHPLLLRGQAVANDVALDAQTRFLLISGSNMAGKSTLLRTVGVNAVLALAGAPVPATRMRLSCLRIGASLAIRDSLADGRSKFLAEVERLRDMLAMAREHPAQTLFLIDEIFSGTNSADRRTAAESVLRGLIAAGSIGALSTHDLALAELAEIPALHGRNVHMASPDESDPLAFDYLLKPGVNRTTNALAIVKMLGLS
jgi:hypothetical protein